MEGCVGGVTSFARLDLVGREYGGFLGAMTSCQSKEIRRGSVALILSAENCGKQGNGRSRFELRGGSVFFNRALVDVVALG